MKNIDNLDVQRLVYHSHFFEVIAIDYAYSIGKNDIAERLIYLGYDRYFELDTFFLMRKYNKQLYLDEIKKVKKICLKRGLFKINDQRLYPCMTDVYGDVFCNEFIRLAKEALADIENSPDTDPRKIEERNIPDWAQ